MGCMRPLCSACPLRDRVLHFIGENIQVPGQLCEKLADIGLTHKDIHEARLICDAEVADPGIGITWRVGCLLDAGIDLANCMLDNRVEHH
jgi:hypothetical protein